MLNDFVNNVAIPAQKRSGTERRETEKKNAAKKKKEALTKRTPTVINSAGARDRTREQLRKKGRVGTVLSDNTYLG